LRKPAVANRLEIAKLDAIRQWMSSPDGPLALWDSEERALTAELTADLKLMLEESNIKASGLNLPIELDRLTLPSAPAVVPTPTRRSRRL